MNVESIKAAVAGSHKNPIFIQLSDGRSMKVEHPDFVNFSRRAEDTEFIVWLENGGVAVVSIDEVVSVEMKRPLKSKDPQKMR